MTATVLQKSDWAAAESQSTSLESRVFQAECVPPGVSGGNILCGWSLHPHLRTVRPFAVSFERTQAGVAAIQPQTGECGIGASRSEALDDLRRTLAHLYFALESHEKRLPEHLIQVWQGLQQFVVKTR